MNALELRGLTKHYKDFTLGPLDLTLPGGTICGLIGENGAGKSTTIKLILDMLQKDGGTVTILGRDSRTASVRSKEEIGVVLGSDGIPLCLNAVEVGKVMAGIYRNWDAGDYTAFCRKFDLPPDKKYKDYSAGMQRKLCIAVALSHHAKLLLLDEATNGLDPVVRDEVTDILLDFARDEEHSILISSHIVSDLEKLCDTIAFLHKGRLLLCEEKDALREEYALWHGTAAQLVPPCIVWGLGLAAPASWMVLSKAHAAIHTHLVPMLWHFAFVPISCMLLPVLAKLMIPGRKKDLVASH